MIAYLKGKFEFKSPAVVHVEVGGVGYEVFISLNTYTALSQKKEGLIYTFLQIKEDGHTLYGFADVIEKEMFGHLLSVSGIGANTARMILSAMKPEEVSRAIVNSDTKLLESIKGIGKKTAERTIVELKDKLAKSNNFEGSTTTGGTIIGSTIDRDALNALLALGIARNMAEQAVKKATAFMPQPASVEDIIKKALQLV
jgi:holliday junction DNA helicase RuvA